MLIYKLTNKINGKAYIGQTIQSLKCRWNLHASKSSGCLALKAALDKYGKENFEVVELFNCNSIEELNQKEQEFISKFNTLAPMGYNLTTGGHHVVFSDESKEKMSNSRKAYVQPKHVIEKQAQSRTGSKNHNFGKTFSLEHRKKLSDSHIGKISRKGYAIKCNESGKIYVSISEASRVLGINAGQLHQVITGKRKTAKGRTFSKAL